MAGALPARILVHRAETLLDRAAAPLVWVEGEPTEGTVDVSASPATSWPCVLFVPQTGETSEAQRSWRPRAVQRPTVMWNPGDVVGDQPGKDARLAITAPELAPWTGAERVVWQVDGLPQPAGPPGAPVVVVATVKQVVD